jgi:hypothetical protein
MQCGSNCVLRRPHDAGGLLRFQALRGDSRPLPVLVCDARRYMCGCPANDRKSAVSVIWKVDYNTQPLLRALREQIEAIPLYFSAT